jgi:hypothetical protein
MARNRLVSAGAVAGLLVCVAAVAASGEQGAKSGVSKSKAAKSGVEVHKVRIIADKYVVVDQQPIVVLRDNRHGKIVWELPPSPSPYRFRDDGIAIDYDQFLGCHPFARGFRYECTDRTPRTKALYPYRITVYGPDKNAEPLTADATVQND